MTPVNFLVISASLHSDSNSRRLAAEAHRALEAGGHAATLLDMRDLPLPLCDGETARDHGNVERARRLIAAADGILVATPIYNYDASAVVKNLVELTGDAWEDRVVGFLCAAAGHGSYMSIMALANSLMLDFRCVIVPRFVFATDHAFAGDRVTEPKILERIAGLARETARLAAAMRA